MKCLLCKINDANQTGSHIITHSLVKNCTNQIGKKNRNQEIAYSFSQKGEKSIFFGSQILPEKIKPIIGKDLSEEEIKANINPIVFDNIYCDKCEKLFGVIESKSSTEFIGKVRENGIIEFENKILIRLYFYIQIWRLSSIKFNNWSLEPMLEEQLRKIIIKGCEKYISGIEAEFKKDILRIPIIITHLKTSKECETSNLVFIPERQNSHLFIFCDFIIEFFLDDINDCFDYFGLNDELKETEINYYEDKMIIRTIEENKRNDLISSIYYYEFVVPELIRIKERFTSEFNRVKNVNPIEKDFEKLRTLLFDWKDIPHQERLSDIRIDSVINLVINE